MKRQFIVPAPCASSGTTQTTLEEGHFQSLNDRDGRPGKKSAPLESPISKIPRWSCSPSVPAGVNTHRNGRGPGRVGSRSMGCSDRQHPSLVESSSYKAGGDGWTSVHPSSLPSSASSGHCLGAFVSFRVVPGTFGGWLGKAANFWVCTSRILSRGTGRFNRIKQRPWASRAGVGVSESWEWLAFDVARVVVVFACDDWHVPCSWVVRKT